MRKLILWLCICLMLFAGCSTQQAVETESPVSDASEPFYNLYFSHFTWDPFEFSEKVSAGKAVYFDQIIKTNTTEITVENTGDIPFTVEVCYPDDPEQILVSFPVKPGGEQSVSGLSSALRYCLWFTAESDGTIQAIISG